MRVFGALDNGQAVIIPGFRKQTDCRQRPLHAARVADPDRRAVWFRPRSACPPGPPIEVRNDIEIQASAKRVWQLLTDVEGWPSWWRACRWVRIEGANLRGECNRPLTVGLPVEGASGRAAQCRRDIRPPTCVRHHCGRGDGRARRAYVHASALAGRLADSRGQP